MEHKDDAKEDGTISRQIILNDDQRCKWEAYVIKKEGLHNTGIVRKYCTYKMVKSSHVAGVGTFSIARARWYIFYSTCL